MDSTETKKFIFLLALFIFFSGILALFFLFSGSITNYHLNYFELLLFFLVCLSFPANIYLSGTGILIFSLLCIIIFLLSSLIFHNIFFILAIPLFIAVEFLARRQFENFSREKIDQLVEIEKVKEQINDNKEVIEGLASKRESLDMQISSFSNLRNYISEVNISMSKEYQYERILDFVARNIPNGDIYSLNLLDENQNLVTTSFIIREANKDVMLRPDKSDIFNKWVMRYRSPLRINNVHEDYRFQIKNDEPLLYPLTKSMIASPLISDNKPMGLIRIDSLQKSNFQINDFRLLVIISNISASALRNSELIKETEKLSITDGLTGLLLPHFMFNETNNYINEYNNNRKKTGFSVLMMDLDFFKSINDCFGHVVGDNVLIHVASILSKFCPPKGMAVRYGGEEFVMILPGFSKKDAFAHAEKIRMAIYEKKMIVRKEEIKVSVSIGVATFPEDSSDSRLLLQKADEKLYLAKSRGRNKTVSGT
ncbi:MAG: GAF domain/GGDEF protein [uncultured bacterium]|nr:MAG: GAF domain/GGDEF protein [uncultured bacterium]